MDEREKWLEERKTCIGGSDASSIVGMNPWKSNIQLWEEKTGKVIPEDIGDKPAVRYGIESEGLLRKLFELDYPQYEVGYNEFKIHRHKEYDFIGSTLDGELYEPLTGQRGALEIKTSNIMRSTQFEKWKDKIPDNYYIQILHQLLCTGWDFALLKAHLKSDWNDEVRITTKHYIIKKSEVLEDIEYLKEKEIRFWTEYVLKGVEPPLVLPNI